MRARLIFLITPFSLTLSIEKGNITLASAESPLAHLILFTVWGAMNFFYTFVGLANMDSSKVSNCRNGMKFDVLLIKSILYLNRGISGL